MIENASGASLLVWEMMPMVSRTNVDGDDSLVWLLCWGSLGIERESRNG